MKNKRYFGLHFDFHAGNNVEIGGRTNAEDIEYYIEKIKPDYIQCDCKGHPGNSSYPTKVGKSADKLVADNLRVWVDAAHKHNLPIYVHYSGVIDNEYVKKYPEKATRDENGEIRDIWGMNSPSLFSDYVDDLLIPQIKELVTEYGIDGIWIDGDNWGVTRDYSDLAKPHLWEGITVAEHNEVMRKAFRAYVKKYVDEIHKFKPGFQIASNWAYSTYMPEPMTIDVDYISGDYQDAVHARYEGRGMSGRGKTWDLMSWGFGRVNRASKSGVQLCQEAAMTIALGGGFQIYNTQNKDGSIKRMNIDHLCEVSEFVRKREMFFEKKPIAQIAVLYSGESCYAENDIFNAAGTTRPMIGVLNALLDAQYTVDLLYDYQTDKLGGYDVVFIPEWKYINDGMKGVLTDYVKAGGNVIVVGGNACADFGRYWGIKTAEPVKCFKYIKDENDNFFRINGMYADLLVEGEESIYDDCDTRDRENTACLIKEMGNGKVGMIPVDFGSLYYETKADVMYDFLKRVLKKFIKPIVEINKKKVDITMQENGDGILVNLINIANFNQNYNLDTAILYSEVPPIYDVEITVNKPYKNVSMPLGEDFDFEVDEACTKIKLKRLDIHSIIELN